MEYCAHCRAIRPTRKSSRRRTVRQPDGTAKVMIVDSYHCSRCQHFIGSVEREATPQPGSPAGTPPADTAAAPPDAGSAGTPAEMPSAAEEVEAAAEAPAAPSQ